MQRVRVGLTGLAAVLLIVAVSTAIFESAKVRPDEGPVAADDVRSEQVVANMLENTVEPPSEPLAEIGVTPGASPTAPPAAPPPAAAAPAPFAAGTPLAAPAAPLNPAR